jgi:hypothetical protein
VRVNVQEFLKLTTDGGEYSAWHSGNFIPHECTSYIYQPGDWANVIMAHVSPNVIPIQFKIYQLHQNFITINNRTFPQKACWDSSVGIVMGYGMDGVSLTLAMQNFSLHPRATQPPILWVWWVKRQGHEANHLAINALHF